MRAGCCGDCDACTVVCVACVCDVRGGVLDMCLCFGCGGVGGERVGGLDQGRERWGRVMSA